MKLMIQNYSSEETTEPLYINECVNRVDGSSSTIWGDKSVSAYDMFDTVKPDLLLTHYTLLSNDIVKYLSSSDIELVINITGAEQGHVDTLEEIISTNGIKCPLIFTNKPQGLNQIIQRKTKLVSIMHAADPFLKIQKIESPEYSLDAGFFCNYPPDSKIKEIAKNYATHHYLSTINHLVKDVDICIPLVHLHGLYGSYGKNIISSGDVGLPQQFFDSILYGNETFFHCRKDSHEDKMRKALGSLSPDKSLLYKDGERPNFNKVRDNVIAKHTAVSRTQRLFGRLSNSSLVDSLHKVAEEISNDYSST